MTKSVCSSKETTFRSRLGGQKATLRRSDSCTAKVGPSGNEDLSIT